MHKLSPILWTNHLNETIQFYETVLGFKGESNFPDFVSLTNGAIEIMFVVPKEEREDCNPDGNNGHRQLTPLLTGSLYFFMKDVESLWHSVKDRVTVKYALQDREYLMRDFSILDNNGYELVFGEDISKKSI